MEFVLLAAGLGLVSLAGWLMANAVALSDYVVIGSAGVAGVVLLGAAAIVEAVKNIPERQRDFDVALKLHIKDLQAKEARKTADGQQR